MFSRILLPLSKQSFQIERVKFGVPLEQVCGSNNELPGPLLVLILKLNKEAPYKKDVFRAPGHQSSMKKLIHCLQTGRLVNIDNYSVYTIASVLKKFLRKLPGGVFGVRLEAMLFNLIRQTEQPLQERQQQMARLLARLPLVNQHLLVLLFGTFNAIANCAHQSNTGMTSEAIGVSVAPSFFHSCVSNGCKIARMEDVQRFKLATLATQFLIEHFGVSDLFGHDNYEYYARISGRLLRVEANWVVAYKYPPMASPMNPAAYANTSSSTTAYPTTVASVSQQTASSSSDATRLDACATIQASSSSSSAPTTNVHMQHSTSTTTGSTSADPYAALLSNQTYGRLSMSLEDNVFKCTANPTALSTSSSCSTSVVTSSSGGSAPAQIRPGEQPLPINPASLNAPHHPHKLLTIYDARSNSPSLYQPPVYPSTNTTTNIAVPTLASSSFTDNNPISEEDLQKLNLDQLKMVNRCAESTKSLSFLPIVHERQTARMKTRSEWFLNPSETSGGESEDEHHRASTGTASAAFGLIGSALSGPSGTSTGPIGLGSTGGGGGGSSSSSSSSSRNKAIVRKSSSKEKRLIRRSSSKKDKENGSNLGGIGLTSAVLHHSNSSDSTTCSPKFGVLAHEEEFADTRKYKPRI